MNAVPHRGNDHHSGSTHGFHGETSVVRKNRHEGGKEANTGIAGLDLPVHNVDQPELDSHVPASEGFPHGADKLRGVLINVVNGLEITLFLR